MAEGDSFTRKVIELKFVLQDGDFGGGNALTDRGLSCKASIDKPGPPDKNTAKVDVYGLTLQKMEQLTTLGFGPGEMQRNLLVVRAGVEDTLSVVF